MNMWGTVVTESPAALQKSEARASQLAGIGELFTN